STWIKWREIDCAALNINECEDKKMRQLSEFIGAKSSEMGIAEMAVWNATIELADWAKRHQIAIEKGPMFGFRIGLSEDAAAAIACISPEHQRIVADAIGVLPEDAPSMSMKQPKGLERIRLARMQGPTMEELLPGSQEGGGNAE
ncbi:MAG TPA: hypothetical protein VIE65_08945, partial [Methylobacter sp.]